MTNSNFKYGNCEEKTVRLFIPCYLYHFYSKENPP